MSNSRTSGVFESEGAAFRFNERTQTMFGSTHLRTSCIALAGCSIATVLAVAAPRSTGGAQAAMPTSGWRAFSDQRAVHAARPEPGAESLVGTVTQPIGQGWG
jgi:hypothetical protein